MESLQNVSIRVKPGACIDSVNLKVAYLLFCHIYEEYQKYLKLLWEYPLNLTVMHKDYELVGEISQNV